MVDDTDYHEEGTFECGVIHHMEDRREYGRPIDGGFIPIPEIKGCGTEAEHAHDHAKLTDRRIRKECFEVRLAHGVDRAIEECDEADPGYDPEPFGRSPKESCEAGDEIDTGFDHGR